MNLDRDFFQVSKLSEDQKKGLHLKKENFVPQIVALKSNVKCTLKSNYWGDAGADYTQIIGVDTVKLGGYISPSPLRVSAPLSVRR